MVTCWCVGGPLDGLRFEEEQPPPVYARVEDRAVYFHNGGGEYVHASAERLARHPVTIGYALDGSVLGELATGLAHLRLFGHGDGAAVYARTRSRGRVAGIQSNPATR